MGSILRAAGYRDAAEAADQNAHALAPGVMRWPYYLGHLYRQEGAREKAAAFFERALELDPVNVPALTWLGGPHRAPADFARKAGAHVR